MNDSKHPYYKLGGVILQWKRSLAGTSFLHLWNYVIFAFVCSLYCSETVLLPTSLPTRRPYVYISLPPTDGRSSLSGCRIQQQCVQFESFSSFCSFCCSWSPQPQFLFILLHAIYFLPHFRSVHTCPQLVWFCTHCHLNRSWDQDQESKGLLSYEEQANNDNLWNLNQFWLVSPCSAMWLSFKKNPGSLPQESRK